jgi:hypothetical protein
MKTVRGDLADFEKLRAVHQKTPLDLSVLLKRYEQEMGHVVIDPRRLRGNFPGLVDELFPEAAILVRRAFERPDQRTRLETYLASQKQIKRRPRSRRSVPER